MDSLLILHFKPLPKHHIMKKEIIIFFVILFMVSCQDALENLNVNPNQEEEVPASELLTSATRNAINSMVLESFLLGNNASQLTAKTLRAEVDIYSWNSFPTVWQSMYESIADIKEMERLSRTEGNNNMEGVAVVLKVWMFSVLTNAYGDIPYTEAARGAIDNVYAPKYDQQELIYVGEEGLLNELERATKLLEPDGATIEGDIIYGGDATKWEKLANSLKLRLLMYASNQIDVSAEVQSIVEQGVIMESNEDNATLSYLNAFPNEFPIIPLKTGDFDAVVMGQNAINLMNDYNDPRRIIYARPDNLDFIAPEFSGAINGSENPDICNKAGSRLGLDYYNYPDHPISANQAEGILMTYAEVEFILAEAVAKGWLAGTAANHYEKGIKASMDYYLVDYTAFGYEDFDDYYLNSGVSFTNSLQILEQKWLALFFTGLEPYFEVRRWLSEAGFDWNAVPFLSPTCQNVNNDNLPVRFLYPAEEQSLNGNNYQEAVSRIGEDSQNSITWLLE